MNELALFAGAGGGLLASKLLGWTTVCAVEIEKYPRDVLLARQRDGILEKFPIWDDVRTFDGKPWRRKIDVISRGFPCQDISAANSRGKGLSGERSGLWSEYLRIIKEIEPSFIFAENSPVLRKRGLGQILSDLTQIGYDARWICLGGVEVGIPCKRDRMFIVAGPNLRRLEFRRSPKDANSNDRQGGDVSGNCGTVDVTTHPEIRGSSERKISLERWQETKPELLRTYNAMASWMDRKKAIGNGQVPIVAATAWNILTHNIIK